MASNGAAEDLATQLQTAGAGTIASTSGWRIGISYEPDGAGIQDTTITAFDTGGLSPNPKWLLDQPSVQIRVRGAPMGYQAAYDKARECMNALLGLTPATINGTYYAGVVALGDINHISNDESDRPILTLNLRAFREPATGTNRTSL